MPDRKILYDRVSSDLGDLMVAACEEGICRIGLTGEPADTWQSWFERYFKEVPSPGGYDWIRKFSEELGEYLAGRLRSFRIPVVLRGTEFQLKVWKALWEIPFGVTTTYGELAESLGRRGGARAVGGAAARNPVPILVPCHRLVGVGGRLVGFSAGLELKERLLQVEGVRLRW